MEDLNFPPPQPSQGVSFAASKARIGMQLTLTFGLLICISKKVNKNYTMFREGALSAQIERISKLKRKFPSTDS